MAIIELVGAITSTFMRGFKNNFAQVFSMRSSYAIKTTCLGRLKVKDTLEGQMIKWS